jgi:hypothetical protein
MSDAKLASTFKFNVRNNLHPSNVYLHDDTPPPRKTVPVHRNWLKLKQLCPDNPTNAAEERLANKAKTALRNYRNQLRLKGFVAC